MGWKQWSLVAVVIGGGILLQIPGDGIGDLTGPDGMEAGTRPADEASMARAEIPASHATVVLNVTGMT